MTRFPFCWRAGLWARSRAAATSSRRRARPSRTCCSACSISRALRLRALATAPANWTCESRAQTGGKDQLRMKSMFTKVGFLLAASLLPLSAQWQLPKDKATPRTKDGQPDLRAPAPRRADGKPDLTGIWIADPPKLRDATVGLKPGEVAMTPWAQKTFDERKTGDVSAQDPDANCLPQGVPKIESTPLPFKIFQEPNAIVLLYEAF